MHHVLEPEVAGALGPCTVLDRSVHPPIVIKLDYEIEAWLGDDLLQAFPCYIATRRLADALAELRPSGVRCDRLKVTKAEQFDLIHDDPVLPEFVWCVVDGTAGVDDFGMSSEHMLVVSDRVLAVMRTFSLANCGISPYGS